MSRKCKSLGSYEQLNGDMYFILKQRAKRKEKKKQRKSYSKDFGNRCSKSTLIGFQLIIPYTLGIIGKEYSGKKARTTSLTH